MGSVFAVRLFFPTFATVLVDFRKWVKAGKWGLWVTFERDPCREVVWSVQRRRKIGRKEPELDSHLMFQDRGNETLLLACIHDHCKAPAKMLKGMKELVRVC